MKINKELIFIGVMLTLIITSVGLSLYYSDKSFNDDYEFYSEWCQKLGAEIIEPIKGYNWNRECFKEKNGTITRYFITKVNEEYYLQEKR